MSTPSQHSSDTPLVRFYDPAIAAPDARGRTLSSILAWDDNKLESRHDYIQTLFPLPEESLFNYYAPIVDNDTYKTFHAQPELRDQLKKSFIRMLKFYGLERQTDGHKIKIVRGSNFSRASRNWVVRFDHNHLRITRIIRCLRVLHLSKDAWAFYLALIDIFESEKSCISHKSMMFWTRAAKRYLYVAPEEDDDFPKAGKDFLYEVDRAAIEKAINDSTDDQKLKQHVSNFQYKGLEEEEVGPPT